MCHMNPKVDSCMAFFFLVADKHTEPDDLLLRDRVCVYLPCTLR